MQNIGQILKEAREKKGIELSQASHDSKIKLDYIVAMEANQFERVIAPAYARSFLRMYADYLGLDAKYLLEQLHKEPPAKPSAPSAPPPTPVVRPNPPSARAPLKFKAEDKTSPPSPPPPPKPQPVQRRQPQPFPFPLQAVLVCVVVIVIVLAGIAYVWKYRGGLWSKESEAPKKYHGLIQTDPSRVAETLDLPRPDR